MPNLSMFYGIIISMYDEHDSKHHIPHIHAKYGEFSATLDLEGSIIAGEIPNKQLSLLKAWILLHQEELSADWILLQNGQAPYKIKPLD